jgi:hypothetical protein
MSDLPRLKLGSLHERHPGLTQALGDSYIEAACVCWARHHKPPITVSVKRENTDELRLVNFAIPDARTTDRERNRRGDPYR